MPEVSIIVPVYKVEPFIHRCVNSILSQTFSNFELILVDDGSPDNCPAICDDYATKDSRVHVIHKENGGLSSARNSGIEKVQGKYILFCDSDDYVSDQWCETLIDAASGRQNCFVFGGIQTVFSDKTDTHELGNQIQEYSLAHFLDFHTKGIVGFACNVLFDANVIRAHNLRFRNDVIIEDLPFCLEYLKYMDSLVYCGHAGYYYVQRDSSTLSRKYYQDGFRKWREKYASIQVFIEQCIALNEQDSCRKITAECYLYYFLTSLNNTFDKRSTLSFPQKLKYNQSVISSPEFKHCLQYCDGKNENHRYLKILKTGNYYLVYLYVYGAKTKNFLRKKIS